MVFGMPHRSSLLAGRIGFWLQVLAVVAELDREVVIRLADKPLVWLEVVALPELTRSSSPWIWALTPLGPSSRISLPIFLSPDTVLHVRGHVPGLARSRGSVACTDLRSTPRRTSLVWKTSQIALTCSSPFACIAIASPDHLMDASVPLKSKRWPTSRAAWLSALFTSCRLTLLTMSKELSDAMLQSCQHLLAIAFCRLAAAIPEQGAATAPRAVGKRLPVPCLRAVQGIWASRVPSERPRRPGEFCQDRPFCYRHSSLVHSDCSLPEWPKGAVCKTVGDAYDGSNPSAAAKTRSIHRPALTSWYH